MKDDNNFKWYVNDTTKVNMYEMIKWIKNMYILQICFVETKYFAISITTT